MKRVLAEIVAVAGLSCLAAQGTAAADRADLEVGETGFSGYLKSYVLGFFPKAPSENYGEILNAARFNLFSRPANALKLEADYELQPAFLQHPATPAALGGTALPFSEGIRYRVADLDPEIAGGSPDRDFHFYQNLDRLVAYWKLENADIVIGRQAITFGSARVIQATDVLLPYSFQQVSTEYRIGVDAVRAEIPLSQLAELDLGVVPGEGFRMDQSAAFLRTRATLGKTDFTALAMTFSGAQLLGGGIQRGIWQLGYTLDLAQVWAENHERYFRLSTGVDYSFESNLVLFLEYHFNGAGADDPAWYLPLASHFAFQKGGVFLLGRHYLIPGLTYPITPLLNFQFETLFNALDGSAYVSGSLAYSATDNLYLDAGVSLALGAESSLSTFRIQSEFGSYPTQAYTALRYYF